MAKKEEKVEKVEKAEVKSNEIHNLSDKENKIGGIEKKSKIGG